MEKDTSKVTESTETEVNDPYAELGEYADYGRFVDEHAVSGSQKRDMNFNQIAVELGISTDDVAALAEAVGHKLPNGAL